MPTGTPQDGAAQDVISAGNGYQLDCPSGVLSNPEIEQQYLYQVACGYTDLTVDLMRSSLDLQLLGDYEAVNAWGLSEDGREGVFSRQYKLDPGLLIVNLSESSEGGSALLIQYFEPK